MRFKFLTLLAAVALVAGCTSTPEETVATTSAGTGTSATSAGSGGVETAVPQIDPRSQEWLVVNVGDRVFFDYDRSDLKAESQETIEKVAAWMLTYPDVTLSIEGHCDDRGTREYNLALGDRRANSVLSYMLALGINADRISTISYGKERPAVLGANEVAWAQNRRGVFIVN